MLHAEKVLAPCILPRYQSLRAFRRIAPIGASNRRRVLNRRRVSSSRNDDFIPKRLSYPESINLSNRKPVTVTNPIVLHRHLSARMRMVAPFLSNTLFSRCSISTRALAAGWLGAWLAGCLAGWLAGWGTKMLEKRVPLSRKCVENANPHHESASKVHTLSPKFHPRDPDERRKCNPFNKNSVENATPHA